MIEYIILKKLKVLLKLLISLYFFHNGDWQHMIVGQSLPSLAGTEHSQSALLEGTGDLRYALNQLKEVIQDSVAVGVSVFQSSYPNTCSQPWSSGRLKKLPP